VTEPKSGKGRDIPLGDEAIAALKAERHRNILAEAKSFLRWCTVKKKWLARNPLEEVEGVGKRKHGTTQLRVDEARKWLVKAVALADEGEAGAVAASLALVMGMRANEIVSRVLRDPEAASGTPVLFDCSRRRAELARHQDNQVIQRHHADRLARRIHDR
jgi:hypothetical protein